MKMKKLYAWLLFTCLILAGCKDSDEIMIDVESVTVNLSQATLSLDEEENRSITLVATVLPQNANQAVVWSSSDETVATVDQAGTITAVAEGQTIVTATAQHTNISASCTIDVVRDRQQLIKTELLKAFSTMTTTDVLESWGWNLQNPLSDWEGITYTKDELSINRAKCNLSGSISPELFQITELTSLYLAQNQLSGNIPPEIKNLSNLEELNLSYNQLTGELPTELGDLSQLESLDLSNNQLTGEIPAAMGQLKKLTSLSLWRNQLTGEIPAELGNLSNLRALWLDVNQLTGEIPAELGNLSYLTSFYMSYNQLSGEVPVELGKLGRTLRQLNITYNRLSGPVPQGLKGSSYYSRFDFNPQQDGFSLSNTEIEEADKELLLAIKDAWGENAPQYVKDTWTAENDITEFSNIEVNGNGQVYYLELNDLSEAEYGAMPDLSVLTELQEISISNVPMHSIPDWFKKLTKLTTLYIANAPLNDIRAISGLTSLKSLDIWSAEALGEALTDICKLVHLERLYLCYCGLTGKIPAEIGNLSQLNDLELLANNLSGEIPAELGYLEQLYSLILMRNNLSGEIPESVLSHPYFHNWALMPQNEGYGFTNYPVN